jgi:hypothetical protein
METTAKKADLSALKLGNGPSVAELQAARAANGGEQYGRSELMDRLPDFKALNRLEARAAVRHTYTGGDLERFDARMDLRWALAWFGAASLLLVLFLVFNAEVGWEQLDGPRTVLGFAWLIAVGLVVDTWRRWKRSLRRPMAVPRL